MQIRVLRGTDLRVSAIGMGCQSIGGGLFHRDDAGSIRVLHAALDAGIGFFDTADHYSDGRSESLVGRAFAKRRDRVVLATKVGTSYTALGRAAQGVRPLLRPFRGLLRGRKVALHRARASQKRRNFSTDGIVRAVEASLRRLRTDYLDLVQLHKPPLEVLRRGEFLRAFEVLRENGKARWCGVSCDTPTQAAAARICAGTDAVACIQIQAHLLDTGFREAAAACSGSGTGVIARNPRAQGFLTSDYGDLMAETYARSTGEERARARQAHRFDFLVRPERSLAQAALQYLLQEPALDVVLPRIWNEAGLREMVGTCEAPRLSSADLAQIERARGEL